MKKILVFKTSTDSVVNSLLEELLKNEDNEIYCFIQTNSYDVYKNKYPSINFIDIKSNVFDNPEIVSFESIENIKFNEIYFTSSRTNFKNYGNVIEIASKIKSSKWIFYNGKNQLFTVSRHCKIIDVTRFGVNVILFWIFKITYRLKYLGKDY